MRQGRLRNSEFTCGSVESIEEEADVDGSHEREVGRGRRDAQLAELRIFLNLGRLPHGRAAAQAPSRCGALARTHL